LLLADANKNPPEDGLGVNW